MKIIKLIQQYGVYALVLIFVVLAVILAFSLHQKKKDRVAEKQMKRDVELSDRLFKPAQISIKFVYKDVRLAIEKYVNAIYNNNPMMLPEKMSKEILTETIDKIQRKIALGVQMKLIKFEPAEKYTIIQDNSSIYTVMFLTATAEYKIEYFTEHSTYKRYITKSVRQEIIFEGTNDEGWVMKKVGDEEILNIQQKDI